MKILNILITIIGLIGLITMSILAIISDIGDTTLDINTFSGTMLGLIFTTFFVVGYISINIIKEKE